MKQSFRLFLLAFSVGVFLSPFCFLCADSRLSLESAIQRMLYFSPKLKIAEASVSGYAASIKQSSLYPNPQFAFEIDQFGGSHDWKGWKNRDSRFQIIQLFELGNKKNARINLATYDYYSSLIDYELTKLQMMNVLYKSFVNVAFKQELLELYQQQMQDAKIFLDTVTEQVNAGQASFIQETKAMIALGNAEMMEERARLEFLSSKTKLSLLWGSSCSDFDYVSFPLHAIHSPIALAEYLDDIECHPIISKMDMNYAAAWENVRLEKSLKVPDVILSLGYESDHCSDSKGLIFGFSCPLPVCNRNQGNIARAYSDIIKAENEKKNMQLLLKIKMTTLYHNMTRTYREAERIKNRLFEPASQACHCASEGYHEGKFSYLDVLDAKRTLFDIKAQYMMIVRDYHMFKADLDYLDGENE